MISIVPNLAKTNYHKKMCDGLVKIKGGHVAKRRNFYSTYIPTFTKCVFAFLCFKYSCLKTSCQILEIFQNSFILCSFSKKIISNIFCHHAGQFLPWST